MSPIQRTALVSALALLCIGVEAVPSSAQTVYGRVLSVDQRETLAGAHVALLDARGASLVTTAVTDSTGAYRLEVGSPGSYTLVASREGYASIAPRPVEVAAAAMERVDVELTPLAILSDRNRSAQRLAVAAERACEGRLNQRSSAVMGVVRDSLAGVTLTGVPVSLEQVTPDGRLRTVRETQTDADGFFAFCPLPAPREVAVRADLGERSVTMGVETEPGTGAFLNLYVELATQADPSAIVGVVKDWQTGEPLAGSSVTLRGANRRVTTDVEGRFVFPDVPYGVYVVEVEHLGYGTAREAFYLNGGSTANVEVALSVEAIEVDPIVVNIDRGNQIFGDLAEFEERMSRGLGIFLTAEELERQGPSTWRCGDCRRCGSRRAGSRDTRSTSAPPSASRAGRASRCSMSTACASSSTPTSDGASPSGRSRPWRSTGAPPRCPVSSAGPTRRAARSWSGPSGAGS